MIRNSEHSPAAFPGLILEIRNTLRLPDGVVSVCLNTGLSFVLAQRSPASLA